jgi:hypothetical protein
LAKEEKVKMETKLVNDPLIKKPSAYIPLMMSLAALALVIGHALVYGIVHETDEGAAAHVFQILMAMQVPIIGYFILKWFSKRPKETLLVLGIEAAAWAAAFASVYFLT